jgi:hypothetical protein
MNPLPIIIGLAAAFLLFTGSSNEESSKQLPEFSETSQMMPTYSEKSLTTTNVRRNMYESETSPMNTEIKKVGGNTSLSETSEDKDEDEDEDEENEENEDSDMLNIGGQRNYYSETDTSSFSRKLRKVFNE